MANKKNRDKGKEVGRPSLYRQEYCDMLVKHYQEGGTFESFAAVVDVCYDTLYEWVKAHVEFADAKNRGLAKSYKFYLDMGMRIAAGQMRRISKEKPMLDSNERPITDANGNLVYEKEYAPAIPNAAIWIFIMKNMHGWRDIRNHALSGDGRGSPIPIDIPKQSPQERLKELLEMRKALKEIEEHGSVPVIDVAN